MKKVLIAFLLVAAAGGGWWYFKPAARTAEPQAPGRMDLTAKAEKRNIEFAVEVSGDVAPAFQLDVKAEVGGKLKQLRVQPGQVVKQGDLLAEVDDTDLLTERESALTEIEGSKLAMERNKKNFERAKELYEAKLISLEVYDNLSAEFELAENSLEKAKRKLQLVDDKLRKTKVIAPMDGTVLTVPVIEGQVVIPAASVNSGTTLMTIANLSQLLVKTHVNQVDVARLELNQEVALRAESLRDLELKATVSFIAPIATAKNSVKGFEVEALIDSPNARLRPGMTVQMTIPIDKAQDAIAVPISGVFKGEGNKRVVYVRNGEATERREVQIGVTNFDYAQILKGVEPGEEILLVEPKRGAASGGGGKKRS